jgi:hypothetical protein
VNSKVPNQRGSHGPTLVAIIGVDFGTAWTKAIIRTPFVLGGRAAAVPLGKLLGSGTTYLLPTRIYGSKREDLFLVDVGSSSHTQLKTTLLNISRVRPAWTRSDYTAIALAAAFLSRTIAAATDWFVTTQLPLYGAQCVRWQINIGIPSAGYDDRLVRDVFGVMAQAAYALSNFSAVSIDVALRAVENATDKETWVDFCAIVPEVVAEVVGYARSPERRDGLHFMIDVGASTLDVCGFILSGSRRVDRYMLLTADVQRLGALEIHYRRLRLFRECGYATKGIQAAASNYHEPIPNSYTEYFGAIARDTRDRFEGCETEFVNDCRRVITAALIDLKKMRDPNALAWRDGLPVFVCGGGRRMRLFRDAIKHSEKTLCKVTTAKGLMCQELPRPSQLTSRDVSASLFQRLAVAYGLSFDVFDIGEIKAPQQIDDVPPPRITNLDELFVSKEQV